MDLPAGSYELTVRRDELPTTTCVVDAGSGSPLYARGEQSMLDNSTRQATDTSYRKFDSPTTVSLVCSGGGLIDNGLWSRVISVRNLVMRAQRVDQMTNLPDSFTQE
jgi:hypothetical protein